MENKVGCEWIPEPFLFALLHFKCQKLQRLQNTAARIVLPHLSKLPSTSLLRELHWLPVHSRVTYKLACLTYNSLTTSHPGYLRSLINYYTPAALCDQLTNFFLIVHGSPLNLAKDPSATSHPQSGTVKHHLKTHLFT